MDDIVSRAMFELTPAFGGFFEKLGAHQTMLMDHSRCELYRRAIEAVVSTDSVVLDIGTGTGILAMFAARAGAKRVIALERGNISDLARRIIALNGYSDSVAVIQEDSRKINLCTKVSVVVSETVGFWGIDEGIVEIMRDAQLRHCLPDAVLIPTRLSLWLTPVFSPSLNSAAEFWSGSPHGFDFSPAATQAATTVGIRMAIKPTEFMAEPTMVGTFELGSTGGVSFTFACSFLATTGGFINGFCGWFDLEMIAGLYLSTDPRSELLHWKQCAFPIGTAITVSIGDEVRLELGCTVTDSSLFFEWRGSVTDSGGRPTHFG